KRLRSSLPGSRSVQVKGAADPAPGGVATEPAPDLTGLDPTLLPLPHRAAPAVAAWCERGLYSAALLFFPLLVLVPRGVAALPSVAGLCGAGLVLSADRRSFGPALAPAAILLCCLLVWGALSAFWSITPGRSVAVAGRLTGLFAAGLALAAASGSVA